ncbi:DRB0094 family RNA ligase [Apiospora saccharicola]|uniref:DRB0094 family RNA ligase n=1 Tax=Apiospora saccharicola TaxID=335842 RepID=A0ABR1WGN0_9PEZI
MARSLASVRQIAEVKHSATKGLLLAEVDGWQCALKKGIAAVGDYIVYFEIDSFLPATDVRFASLEKTNTHNGSLITWNGKSGFHVKSILQQGTVSQGLIMPLGEFPEITKVISELEESAGKDEAMQKVMAMSFESELQVLKWEHNATVKGRESGNSLGPPPFFLPGSGLKRVQNLPSLFTDEKYKDAVYQETVKMDGMAETIYFVCRDTPWYKSLQPLNGRADMPQGRLGVCSHKNHLPDKPGCLFWQAALSYELLEKLADFNMNIAIQGELCGSSICKNREGFPKGEHDFYVYRIWNIDAQTAFSPSMTEELAGMLGLKHVEVNGYYRLHDIATSQEELLQRAEGVGIFGKPREGLVYKDKDGGRFFKVISNAYLIGHGV